MLATALLIGTCTLAAFGAALVGLPLPYLMGPLLASATLCLFARSWTPETFHGLEKLRFAFIGVIGLLIGLQVTPDLFLNMSHLWLSLIGLVVFVPVSIVYNYAIFRRIGRYDQATAYYAAMPGGLYESIAFGEAAGADQSRLILQQFLRVIAVVALLPIGLSFWLGAPVGSADGMSLSKPDVPWQAIPVALVAILAGMMLGKLLHFPARQLTGPMAMGALLSLSGLISVEIPEWLVHLALIVVGAALGTRFGGLSRRRIVQAFGLALISVSGMLLVGAAIAKWIAYATGQDFDLLLVAFAPGGVTEMTLVALSLAGNPAIVTLHHIIRILLTVVILAGSARWIRARFRE